MKLHRTSPLVLFFCLIATSALAVTSGRDAGFGGLVLRASVPMGTVVGTGDRISFEYQTRQDAAVLVFNIDSQGVVHLLSPTGAPEISRANATYPVPSEGEELVVDSQTGVEFVFAISVDDPTAIDTAELDRLRDSDARGTDPVRIDGDPFVAANMIAGELVRGVSHRGVYFGYTYFYVNDRVEYPCYLCGACDGTPDDDACTQYRVVQNFDRRDPLAYPLKRAYEMAADVAVEDGIDILEGSDVDVNFYPYGVEARVVDPFYTSLWSNWYLYDPWYWYGPYYPYYDCYPNFYVGFGWGWGWWGGYYCSGWYAGCGWGYNDGYGGYPSGGYQTPEKFKARYKSDALVSTRTTATQRDGSLRIASKNVQNSVSRPAQSNMRSKTGAVTRNSFATGRSKGAIDAPGSPRVKTSVGGKSSRQMKAPGASGSAPRVKGTTRGTAPSRRGISDAPRGGGGYKSRATAPSRGSSRSGVSAPRSSSGMKGSAPPSRGYSAPSRGSSMKSSAPRSAPSSAPRGGGSRSRGR